jgi:hypothetical protein
MDTRRFVELSGILTLGLLVAVLVVAVQGTARPEPPRTLAGPDNPPDVIIVPEGFDASGLEPVAVLAPEQRDDTCPANVTRIIEEESFEGPADDFPNRKYPNWRTFDSLASAPGRNDEIMWGTANCEASVDNNAAWAVGGGTAGSQLSCEAKQYPPDLGEGCRVLGECRINTSLQFISFDTTISSRITGMRVTIDYMADLPDGARFFVGIGDFALDARDDNGGVTIHQLYEAGVDDAMPSNTGGAWRRGSELYFDKINKDDGSGYKELMLTFAYRHNPATTSDGFGVMLDNIHIDFLFDGTTAPCPSPPTPIPTIPTSTPTRPIFTVPPPATRTPTPGPTRIRYKYVPMGLKNGNVDQVYRPPTALTPTTSPTPLPSATHTPPPSETPRPSDTPLPTVTPTWTPQPVPDVRIKDIIWIPFQREQVQEIHVKNYGTGEQEMTGWTVFPMRKVPVQACRFDAGFVLQPEEEFHFYAGRGAEDKVDESPIDSKVCGDGRNYIFLQNGDEAQLLDDFRNVRDRFCWDQTGKYFCAP